MDYKMYMQNQHNQHSPYSSSDMKNTQRVDFLDAMCILEKLPFPAGNRVSILGSVFGPGSECVSYIENTRFQSPKLILARISLDTQKRILDAVPQTTYYRNPVDISKRAGIKDYVTVLELLLASPETDILLCQSPFDIGLEVCEELYVKEMLTRNIADILDESSKPVLFFCSPENTFPAFWPKTIVGLSSIPRAVSAVQFLVDFKNTLEIKILEGKLAPAISYS